MHVSLYAKKNEIKFTELPNCRNSTQYRVGWTFRKINHRVGRPSRVFAHCFLLLESIFWEQPYFETKERRPTHYFNEVLCANSNFTEEVEHKIDVTVLGRLYL